MEMRRKLRMLRVETRDVAIFIFGISKLVFVFFDDSHGVRDTDFYEIILQTKASKFYANEFLKKWNFFEICSF